MINLIILSKSTPSRILLLALTLVLFPILIGAQNDQTDNQLTRVMPFIEREMPDASRGNSEKDLPSVAALDTDSKRARLPSPTRFASPIRDRFSQTSIVVDAWPNTANQGDMLLGEFRGTNTGTASGGPFPVTQFKIKVTIPPQLTLTNKTSAMGTWTVENQVATLDVGNFAAGEEFSFSMEFEARGSGDVILEFDVEQLEFHPGTTKFNCPVMITVTPIAYVDPAAVGPGEVGNIHMPFPGVLEALDALRIISADDKRICIVPASYPGLAVFDFELEARTWNGESGANKLLDVPGPVILDDGASVGPGPGGMVSFGPTGLPDPGDDEFFIDTSLRIIDGELMTNGLLDTGNQLRIKVGNGELKTGGNGRIAFPTEFLADDPPGGLGRDFLPGDDGIDLLYFGTTDRTVGLVWPPAESTVDDPDIRNAVRDVTINQTDGDTGIRIILDGPRDSRLNGDLIIGGDGPGQSGAGGSDLGILDILDNELAVNSANGNDSVVEVHNGANLEGGHAGLLRFIGEDDTDFWVETDQDRLRFDFPAIEVDRTPRDPGDPAVVTFDAEGVLSDAPAGSPANNPDVIGTTRFRLTLGEVDLLDGLDILEINETFEQFAGEFIMNGISSVGPDPDKNYRQTVRVGSTVDPGDMIIGDGKFFAGNPATGSQGGDVDVFGTFCLGCTPPATQDDPPPSDALFSLMLVGVHTVVGDFIVGPDTDPSEGPTFDPETRNRYFLGGECGVLPDEGGLFVEGNFNFQGTGDRFDDMLFAPDEQGLRGNVFFVGDTKQTVLQRQDEDAFLCDVVMASRGATNDGIELRSDAWQNRDGTLVLEHGIIDSGVDDFDWIILNPGIEEDLAARNNSARGRGVVDLGSRDSYINGEVHRRVEFGNATGGVITGGYLFPVGSEGEPRDDGVGVNPRDVDFFRPLILQFPDDLGRSSMARVNYTGDPGFSTDPPPAPNPNPDLNKSGGGLLPVLDTVSHLFWKLEFDEVPDQLANIRLVADGLPGVNDISMLRLLQWDCDGTNPRVAGTFSGDNPASAMRVALIDGVVNISQSEVDLQLCQLLGIASEFTINPIGPAAAAQSDFSIVKSAIPSPALQGHTLTYTLIVTNNGPDASSATVTDVLPADVSYNSHTGNCSVVGSTVSCTTNTLGPGQSEMFTILVTPLTAGSVLNRAIVVPLPPTSDAVAANDTSSVQVDVADNVATDPELSLPSQFELLPNYPNPFNPTTTIRYALPHQSEVRIVVYDVLGREVAMLRDSVQPAGWHEVDFDAGNLQSGTYLYRMESDGLVLSRVLVLLK